MNSNFKCLCYFLAIIGGGLLHGVCPGLSDKADGLTGRTVSWEGMHESSQPIFDTEALLNCNAKPNRQTMPSSSGKQKSPSDRKVSDTVPTPSSQKATTKHPRKSVPGDRSTLKKTQKKYNLGEL